MGINTQWGGRRPGAGRPRGESGKSIQVRLPAWAVDWLDAQAGNRAAVLTRLIRKLIEDNKS